MGGTSSCNVVDVEFRTLKPNYVQNQSCQNGIATYAIADPVVRECEDDLDAVVSSRLDNIVEPLQTLRRVIQSPSAIIPDLVKRQARLEDITQLGCVDSVETLMTVRRDSGI